jgi:hypothetical protein
LPEYGGVDFRLFRAAIRVLPNVIQRIAREPDARTHTDIEIELLPHSHDRRVINETFPLDFRLKLRLRRFVWLRSNGTKQTQLMPG